MPQEVERKFLVSSDAYKALAFSSTLITQGYLSINPAATVRVRINGDKAFLTIKGEGSASGTTRYEWEKEISPIEAKELLQLCSSEVVDKIRYKVDFKGFIYEVDEFFGENQGLVVAEIELNHEDDFFEKPDWLGQEVTGIAKYYNAMLVNHPYCKW
ncbi:MAG: CYTH domain-containing protein [Paludibacter sp.]|nr:CYTH domain-containing protein [Paludibacter sp.]